MFIFNLSLKSNLVDKIVTGNRDVTYNLAQVTYPVTSMSQLRINFRQDYDRIFLLF